MKIDAMLEWTAEERAARQKEWTQALFTLRLQKATGQLENPMKIRELKKDLARLATLGNMAAPPAPKSAVVTADAPAAAPAHAAAPHKKAPAKKAAPAKTSAKSKKAKAAKPAAKKATPKAAPKKAAGKSTKKVKA